LAATACREAVAGSLAEVGLPAGEIPSAVYAFNVGIEAGQLAFVGMLLAVGWSAHQMEILRYQRLQRVPVYVMGSLASLWLLERTAALVASGW
jgi:HupE/UreJ protein